MPLKSIREMSAGERRRYSLQARTFNTIVWYSILLGLICFAIGLGMYVHALMDDSMKAAYDIAQAGLAAVTEDTDPAAYAHWTARVYEDASAENLSEEAYYERFREISDAPGYQTMLNSLCATRTEEISDYFFAIANEEDGVLIFIADTDPREGHAYRVGTQVKVPKLLQKYFFSRLSGSDYPRLYYYLPSRGFVCISGAYVTDGQPDDGFLFVMTRANVILSGVKNFAIQYVVAITLAILLVGVLLTKKIRRSVVDPINNIAGAAQDYAKDHKEGMDFSDHFALLNIHTGDEIENLSLVMADMEKNISSYMEELTAVTAEKERASTELNMAAQIQASMLPHVFPPYPDRREFSIFASMEPAKEVGGDFYDFFLIDDDHLCLVMADVSGKGVPAALFMMISKVIIQSCAMLGQSAADILNKTNEALCKDNQVQMFVTVWLGILEISTGKLTMANAGHEYPAFKEPDGPFALYKDPHGFVVGGFDDEVYRSYETQLQPGSKIFLYTDGVPEAMDGSRRQFGLERMIDTLNRDPEAEPELLLHRVREEVRAFTGGADQYDDITMLCLEYRGQA
ncbi:MAG: SpoIIE family protein phosphatase [Clostridia bacterium]|nr:SpoIIE family protein phosphatase [Clostridia bacterium]